MNEKIFIHENRVSFIFSLVILSAGCTKRTSHEHKAAEWKELNSFHELMAKAYHPLKDSGDLAAARQVMNEMADEAEKWAAATLPEKVNTADMKRKLEKLKVDTRSLANAIKAYVADEIVKEKLIALHDQFHEIMEVWNDKEGSEEENDHP